MPLGLIMDPPDMPTVLLIDHESVILDCFRIFFEGSGFKVLTTKRFGDALRILEESHVDLVKTGLVMPDMDGFEFLRLFKERFPAVPVIVSSAYLPEGWPRRAMEAGAVACLQRPLALPDLRAAVEAAGV